MAEYDGPTYADNPYSSPLRRWIYDYMVKEFPMEKTYRSDSSDASDYQKFEKWTQCTQDKGRAEKYSYHYLFDMWAGKASFSTCTSFVAIFVSAIRINGGLMKLGKNGVPITKGVPVFQTLNLSLNKKGWHEASETNNNPRIGDIFAVGPVSNPRHVGIILNSVGSLWQTIEAGGGVIGQYQSISRNGWHAPNPGVCGWINIDEYFDTWSNPNYS